MDFANINWLAVVVAAVAFFILRSHLVWPYFRESVAERYRTF